MERIKKDYPELRSAVIIFERSIEMNARSRYDRSLLVSNSSYKSHQEHDVHSGNHYSIL